MNLAERRGWRLFTLCALYVAQGIPWGFMAYTLPPYLAKRGLDEAEVGAALAMTTLPYAFKWVFGPLIDSFTIPSMGRRRPWILFAQGMMALTVAALIAIPDLTAELELLRWMVFIHTIFNAMQDVAVDALAIDLLDEKERGRANGLMYAAKYGGGAIGGGGMATVIAWQGLRAALVMQVAILVAIMMLPLFLRERPGPITDRPRGRDVLRSLVTVFRLRSPTLTGVLMLMHSFAIAVLATVTSVLFIKHLGWTDTEISQISGGSALFAGLGGSVVGGLLADKVGPRRLAAIAMAGLAVMWIGFGFAKELWTNRTLVYVLFHVEPVFQSVMTVSLFALCMGVAWPRVAASQFTTYMALSNMSATLGYQLAGTIAGVWDYQGIYIAAGCYQLVVLLLFPFIDPSQTRRELDNGVVPRRSGWLVVSAVLIAGVVYTSIKLLLR